MPTPRSASDITRDVLQALLGRATDAIHVRLWDGAYWPDPAPRPATLLLKHPGALRAMFAPGDEVSLGEAYLYDDIDIAGDLEAVYGAVEALVQRPPSWRERLRLLSLLRQLPAESRRAAALSALTAGQRGPARVSGRKHSQRRDRSAVTYHYDVSSDFYRLWLDPQMVYSCAYFGRPDEDLATAQQRKLDYLCRKLRLQAGQSLLDLGCGWGGLLLHAAQAYGVDATGITLSQPQVDLANERIRAAGLDGRCRALLRDYRQVHDREAYDALVSVGMFEHVGEARLYDYFGRAWRLLKPGGVFLNHGIALRGSDRPARGRTFSNTYVFPDGELAPIHVTLRAAERVGFEVRDVESLREHYALTLRHWVRALVAQHDEALRHVDEPTYRVWRLFMSGSAHGFTSGRLNVYQTLLVKPDHGASRLPLTRADWYVSP